MPARHSFSVNLQPAQENQNPTGFSTKPAFRVVLHGSKADHTSQSELKERTLAPLAPTLKINQDAQLNTHSAAMIQTNYNDRLTPAVHIPSSDIMPRYPTYFPQDPYSNHPPPYHGPSYQGSPYHSHPYANNQMMGANFLFSAANYSPATVVYALPFEISYHSKQRDGGYSGANTVQVYEGITSPELSPLTLGPQAGAGNRNKSEVECIIPKKRKRSTTQSEKIENVHKVLREASLTPTTFLIKVLEEAAEDSNGDSTHGLLGKTFYRSSNEGNIRCLLDLIIVNPKGRAILEDWMQPHAVKVVCESIAVEMKTAKLHLQKGISKRKFRKLIEGGDVAGDITPVWSAILTAVVQANTPQVSNDYSIDG